MNLTINSLSSVDRAYGLSAQNKNSKKENVSFEGLNISSKQVKNAAVGFALFAASVLGLSACKSNSSEKSKETANTEYVAPVQDGEEISFEDRINEYMAKDKKVVEVNFVDTVDDTYLDSFRMIIGKGYDKNGKLIREAVFHPHELNPSPKAYHMYYYPGPEYVWIQYLSDRKVSEYESTELGKVTEIEYNKPVKFDGKPGYKKTEFFAEYPYLSFDANKIVTYTKGKAKMVYGQEEYSKDFRMCKLYYDKDEKLLAKLYYIPDKDCPQILQWDAKKSYIK